MVVQNKTCNDRSEYFFVTMVFVVYDEIQYRIVNEYEHMYERMQILRFFFLVNVES